MRIRVTANDLARQKADLAVCFAYEGDRGPRGVADRALRTELSRQMRLEEFRGLPGDRLTWTTEGRYPTRRFVVIGLGPDKGNPGESIRRGCFLAAQAAGHFSAKRLALRLPPVASRLAAVQARAAAEGALLGTYRFERYLTDPKRKTTVLTGLEISDGGTGAAVRRAIRAGETAARAVNLTRDLVNEGPSRMTPVAVARRARAEARKTGLTARVLGVRDLERLGMTALLAVARGSKEAPQVVHLIYRPKKKSKKKTRPIVLVGKGVTFDSGGLNLKLGNSMLHMKSDMAGAAAVLGTMTALAELGCSAEVHGLLGLTENMTGAWAYKPGDVLDTFAGKTVEVGNTDAEGRLVLADVLAYAAKKLDPACMVDLATLTGAVVVALGTRASGLFSRDDDLGTALVESSRRAGEKLWPMPMYDEYLQLLQQGPADLRNVAGRWGGAITAALFLGEFVPRDLPWAHIDIAGPAFNETDQPDAPYGATGAGVLTLLRWLEQA